jgi:hypothetical protein
MTRSQNTERSGSNVRGLYGSSPVLKYCEVEIDGLTHRMGDNLSIASLNLPPPFASVEDVFVAAGFTAEDAQPLKAHAHTDYARSMHLLEPTFCVLATPTLPRGFIPRLSNYKKICIGTLYDWRRHLMIDPDWRPYEGRNFHRRLLTDEQEQQVADIINKEFISQGLFCPPRTAAVVAMQVWTDAHPESEDNPQDPPRFSHQWR